MFSLFKSKSPIQKLQAQYEKLMAEAHQLSTVNRTASDQKIKEANEIMDQIVEIRSKS